MNYNGGMDKEESKQGKRKASDRQSHRRKQAEA
jgi:hypothetical protein